MKKLFVFFIVAVLAAASSAVTITQTFNGGEFPVGCNAYMGENSGSTWSFQTGDLGGYVQAELCLNNDDDGIAKISVPIGSLYPSGVAAGKIVESWMQLDFATLSGSSTRVTGSVGVFNAAGDMDNAPEAVYTRTTAGIIGDGTNTTIYPRMGGSFQALSGAAFRIKMHIYNNSGKTASYIGFDVYAIDSEGIVSETSAYTASGTFLGTGTTLATTLDSFGIKNVLSTDSTQGSVYLLDNMYFSTEGAFTGTMPTPFLAPEPATIAILGLGMIAALRTRKY